jgi:hypothetical protein
MFTATVDLSSFRRVAAKSIERLQTGVRDAVRNAAQEGAEEAKRVGRFKDHTGKLRSGIVAEYIRSSDSSARWDIVSKMKYSKFVEQGTRPHVIVPVRALALRFVINGQVIFARKVNHPGSKPYPFMGPAYLKAEGVIYREVGSAAQIVQRFWE